MYDVRFDEIVRKKKLKVVVCFAEIYAVLHSHSLLRQIWDTRYRQSTRELHVNVVHHFEPSLHAAEKVRQSKMAPTDVMTTSKTKDRRLSPSLSFDTKDKGRQAVNIRSGIPVVTQVCASSRGITRSNRTAPETEGNTTGIHYCCRRIHRSARVTYGTGV